MSRAPFLVVVATLALPLLARAQAEEGDAGPSPDASVADDDGEGDAGPPGDAPPAPEAAAAPAPAPAPSREGPVLELEGLEGLDEGGAAPAREEAADDEIEERFGVRTDKLADLAERARAIVDATTIGGYGEHELHAGPNETFEFVAHRYIVFVYSDITERISTATEIEFEFAGSPLKKDGTLDFGEVLLEFSVVDFELFEWLVFRAGVILMPVGSYNIRHDSPTQDLTERPIAYTTIVPTTWFESGAGFHGVVPLPWDMRLSYEAYAVNGLDARIFDGFGLRAARGSHFEDNNHDKGLVTRLAYSPWLGAEIGLSGYTGQYDLAGNRVNMGNLDGMLRFGPVELVGEIVGALIDPGFVEGFHDGSEANTRDAVPEGMWGFYAQTNLHLRYEPLWAYFPDFLSESVFTAVVRYEGKDTDVQRMSAQGDQRRLTFGLNFRPVEPYVIKTDLQFNGKGVDEVRGAPELWDPLFWDPNGVRFVASVAYLF